MTPHNLKYYVQCIKTNTVKFYNIACVLKRITMNFLNMDIALAPELFIISLQMNQSPISY